ncbi:hypothetical protein AX16_008332 [Volvariella volvacea WC 439]|nr:hypothetical protein AX16_008332 [Volvariella volvacea WC 439]
MDSVWDEDPSPDATAEAEWSKLSNDFTNAGYREGITAGKEASVQEGFDQGFEAVGVPIGRRLGMLRGYASALLSWLTHAGRFNLIPDATAGGQGDLDGILVDARDIAAQLAKIQFTDIAPVDHEAEAHAREHLELEGEAEVGEGRKKREAVEELLTENGEGTGKLTMDDVKVLEGRLKGLCTRLGIVGLEAM